MSITFNFFDDIRTWYLFALLIWRIVLTPIIVKLRHPILTSFTFALLSVHTNWGYDNSSEMRIRLFYFFPYYVLGLYYNDVEFERFLECSTSRIMHKMMTTLMVRLGRHRRYNNKKDTILPSTSSTSCSSNVNKRNHSIQLTIGCLGTLLTLLSCQIVPYDWLEWKYHIDTLNVWTHCIFLGQYVFVTLQVVSVIILVKSVTAMANDHSSSKSSGKGASRFARLLSLPSSSHPNATLAIYSWHWPIADFIAWGKLPYTVAVTNELKVMDPSILQHLIRNTTNRPITFVVVSHVVCYVICILLSNPTLYNYLFKYVNEPNISWLFHTPTTAKKVTDFQEEHNRLRLVSSDNDGITSSETSSSSNSTISSSLE